MDNRPRRYSRPRTKFGAQIVVRLTPAELAELNQAAAKRGVSRSDMARAALAYYVPLAETLAAVPAQAAASLGHVPHKEEQEAWTQAIRARPAQRRGE